MDFLIRTYATPQTTPKLQHLLDEAWGILAMNATRFGRKTVLRALFSGGKDSMVTAHIASQMPEFVGLGHVRTNTGPAADRHSNQALAIASQFGWPVIERSPSEHFAGLVAQFGLPGPAVHTWMYIRLKERAIRKISSASRKPKERIVYATGIRRAESAKRAKVAAETTVVTENEYWVNPIINWSDADVIEYINFHGLRVPHMGHSLDCFCGAYATPEERELIKIEHPDQYEYILVLEEIARAGRKIQVLERRNNIIPEQFCKWGHGMNLNDIRNDCKTKISLCTTCEGRVYEVGSPMVAASV